MTDPDATETPRAGETTALAHVYQVVPQTGRPGAAETAWRALRVTLAGCTGFYVCRYGLDDPVMALYAMFGALPLGLFSRVPGPPRQRARNLLSTLPVAWVLVSLGTVLAVSTWAAAVGVLVVGFSIAYCAVCGAKVAGVAAAFQLFYVLPCFPPYAPDTLGARLIGITVGIVLISGAERLLSFGTDPVPYRVVLADAVQAVGAYADGAARPGADGTAQHWRRLAASRALDAARLVRVVPTERPGSPSARDHALNHAHATTRYVYEQLLSLRAGSGEGTEDTANLLRRAAAALDVAADALRRGAVPDGDAALALAAFDAGRARRLAGASESARRWDAVVRSVAEGARLITHTVTVAAGGRRSAVGAPWRPAPLPHYAVVPAAVLWRERLAMHLTWRSVHLHNALRVALGLALARILVGVLDLSHGFWVLLAVLSLMRTSAADTRATVRPAFIGTVAAAVAVGLLLYGVGDVPMVYAVVLPVVMLVGFGIGPRLGPGWEQAAFTASFVLIFTQLSLPDWHLPEVRLLDVLIGGAIGTMMSLLAWPRGGRATLRANLGDFLTEAARGCRAVVATLRGDAAKDPLGSARRAMLLTQASYLQYRAESASAGVDEPPWEELLACGYRMVRGGEVIVMTQAEAGGVGIIEEEAGRLETLADGVAEAAGEVAGNVGRSGSTALVSSASRCAEGPAGAPDGPRGEGAALVLAVDAEVWLGGVLCELGALRDGQRA